jgi:hypothetical protein
MRSFAGLLLLALQYVSGEVLPPSEDPWYTVPSDLESYNPGETIRSRRVSNRLEPLLPLPVPVSVSAVYQYLYRTTDNIGNATVAATTILIPYRSDPTKLLSYQAAYDSANVDCSPSYTLRDGSAKGGLGGISLPNSTLSIDIPFVRPPTHVSVDSTETDLC